MKPPKDTFVRAKMAEPESAAEADRQWARDNAAALIGAGCVILVLIGLLAIGGAYVAIFRAVHHLP